MATADITLTDSEMDRLLTERAAALRLEVGRVQVQVIALGADLAAVQAAHQTAPTADTTMMLRLVVGQIAAAGSQIAAYERAATQLDAIAAGTADSAKRARNRARKVVADAAAVVLPEPIPLPVLPVG